jgi:hypothetical protein
MIVVYPVLILTIARANAEIANEAARLALIAPPVIPAHRVT